MKLCYFVLLVAMLAEKITVSASAAEPADAKLPKVVLIGDSIRMGYAPFVIEAFKGKATVISNKANGGDSARVLANLDDWAISEQPDVVHFNCGLHDLKVSRKTQQPQVPLDQYEPNLKKIVERLQKETKAKLIFATTTPIVDSRHAKRKGEFDRREADVLRYNEVAEKVMKDANVEINDLHALVVKEGSEKMLRSDGTHYEVANSRKLAKQVTDAVTKRLPE
jgi:lysophospholipase L1-like esterase